MNNVSAHCRSLCIATAVALFVGTSLAYAQVGRNSKAALDVEEAKGQAAALAEKDDALQKISHKLLSPADIQAEKKPLAKFAEDVAKQYEIPLRVDEQGLKAAGVAVDLPVTAEIKKGSLGQALSKVLKEHKLRWEIRETEVVITGLAKAVQQQGAVGFTVTFGPQEPAVEAPQDDPELLQRISRKMLAAADIQADKKPLSKFAQDLAKQYEIPLRVDEQAVKAAGVALDTPVTTEIKKGTLGQALSKVLKEHKLRWEMRDTEVVITGNAKVPAAAPRVVEPVFDGVVFVGQAPQPAQAAPPPKVDPEMLQKISRKMLAAADIQADKTPLAELVAGLSKKYEIPIRIDVRTIQAAGAKPNAEITASIKKGTFGQALTAVLKERGLKWELRDTEVVVTSIAKPAQPVAPVAVKADQARAVAQARALQQAQNQEKALQQQEKQFVPQFRVLWKAELHFVRHVCQPTEEQLTKLQAAGRSVAEKASAQFVRGRNGRRVVNGVITAVTPTSGEPRGMIQEALLPLLEAHLTPEQLARYKDELEQSRTARREMVIENLVSKLDRDLQLSGEQREKLAGELTSNWDQAWSLPTQSLMNLDNAFPTIPDRLVVPTLNERQQKIWGAMPKQNMQNHFGGFGIFGNQIDENVWDGEGLEDAGEKVDASDEAQPVRVN